MDTSYILHTLKYVILLLLILHKLENLGQILQGFLYTSIYSLFVGFVASTMSQTSFALWMLLK